MKNILKPLWLILVITLPLTILLVFYTSAYSIIKTILEEENIKWWLWMGGTITVLAVISTTYSVFLFLRKKEVHLIFPLLYLPIAVVFLYVFFNHERNIFPFSIPQWMIDRDMLTIIPLTMLMPGIAYSVLAIMEVSTRFNFLLKPWKNFVTAILIPAATYVFFTYLLPLIRNPYWRVFDEVIVIGVISCTIVFLFFLSRGIYLLLLKKNEAFRKFELLWKIPLTTLFPLIGLLVNNGHIPFIHGSADFKYIFGNFGDPVFYILCLLNGILLCLPQIKNKKWTQVLFFFKAFTFPFSFYFFFVFLPYLPLSLIALVFLGLGFLLLAPLGNFLVHVHSLTQDYKFLKSISLKPKWLLLSGISLIPLCITINYGVDRYTLNTALESVYSPDYTSAAEDPDNQRIGYLISYINQKKDRSRFFMDHSNKKPYLDLFYNWLVLDNLTLSDKKLNHLERIFKGSSNLPYVNNSFSTDTTNVIIDKIQSATSYDEKNNFWTTNIDLELNNNTDQIEEYMTTFELPEGAYISDYYLYVENEKVKGQLSEKKSALWIYSEIRNTRRDPGILYYTGHNKIHFRVFPFNPNEIRKTGFQVIHRNKLEFIIDKHLVSAGETKNITADNSDVVLISAAEKSNLPKVSRTPYFHFIVDASVNNEDQRSKFIARIQKWKERQEFKNGKISFVNSTIKTFNLTEDWKEQLSANECKGGYFAEKCLKKEIVNNMLTKSANVPVFILVTNNVKDAVFVNGMQELSFTPSDYEHCYYLNEQDKLFALNTFELPDTSSLKEVEDILPIRKVLVWPNEKNPSVYLSDNNKDEIIIKNLDRIESIDFSGLNKTWTSAALLHALSNYELLHPEKNESTWKKIIQGSFSSGILTPSTSYLVLENEAQRAALAAKQKQVLNSGKHLDVSEAQVSMSEPSLYVLLLIFIIFVLFKKIKWRMA